MPLLLDIALAVLVLSGALFLGSVGLTLLRELRKDDNQQEPPKQGG